MSEGYCGGLTIPEIERVAKEAERTLEGIYREALTRQPVPKISTGTAKAIIEAYIHTLASRTVRVPAEGASSPDLKVGVSAPVAEGKG
jgi:hypothetical protein